MEKKRTKRPLRKRLEDKADRVFSRYIRKKYADWRGYCECYTCGIIKPLEEMDNGHYIKRSFRGTRWDEDNCRPQCTSCNQYRGGMQDQFALHLEKDLGFGILQELDKRALKITKLTSDDLRAIIEKYDER